MTISEIAQQVQKVREKITVQRVLIGDAWIANVTDGPWAVGQSRESALARLFVDNQEFFGVEIIL